MNDDALILAIGQVERALSRMEFAQVRLRTKPAPVARNAAELADLEQNFRQLETRYSDLRAAMVTALGQIDTLIAAGEE